MAEKVQKATKKVIVTGLKMDDQGKFIVKTEKDALQAVRLGGRLTTRIDAIKREELSLLEANLENVRAGLRDYQVENELAEVVNEGWKSDLVERTSSMWIWQDGDLPENIEVEGEVVPLKDILKKKIRDPKKRQDIINRITKRILVPSAIDDVVKEGLLKTADVADAFVEFVKTSYVQIKEVK